ncbi:ATP12 family chaperone protein [Pontixanthobacter sp.]|uniref:ATP12 family chaperone protein n=1 Tax=Pontixanthobacter sp. TaxID=2792078 RepID=UPI003C7B3CE1
MKRFYKAVDVAPTGDDFTVTLDSRAVKTPLGAVQRVPTRALADALAAEWNGQGDMLDLALFRLRDLADYAIDIVAPAPEEMATKLLAFLETDTLCYRADPDELFFKRQLAVWEPVLTAFEADHSIKLERISGIMHRPQPDRTVATLRAAISALDAFTLSELMAKTSLSASLAVGMASLRPDADPAGLWAAANLEEDWQIEQWGSDYEAELVRKRRTADFMNAHAFGQFLR